MRCYFWQCFYHCLLWLSYIFCIFVCYSLVVPLLLLYLLLHAHHLTGISLVSFYSSLLSFPCPLLTNCAPLCFIWVCSTILESFSHLPPSSTSLFSYAKDPLSNNHKVNKRTKALLEGYSSYLKIAL